MSMQWNGILSKILPIPTNGNLTDKNKPTAGAAANIGSQESLALSVIVADSIPISDSRGLYSDRQFCNCKLCSSVQWATELGNL